MSQINPRVYISYSHDSEDHIQWVRDLGERLRADGVDVILDQWELLPGDDIRKCQERWLDESEAVVLVLTPGYSHRMRDPETGVGFEYGLLGLLQVEPATDTPRIIPIVRERSPESFPGWLEARYRLDFQTNQQIETSYPLLLDALFGRRKAPPLGKRRGARRPAMPRARARSPVVLERIDVTKFRALQSLDLKLRPPVKGRGQWTVLLGDNGVGKSSLLWAVCLALTGTELGHGILAGLASSLVRGDNPPEIPPVANTPVANAASKLLGALVNAAKASAVVDSHESGVELTYSDRRNRLIGSIGEAADFPLFAYGSGRGSALGGPDRAVELDRPLDAIGTLFGLRTNLVHAETWLRGLEHSSLKDPSGTGGQFFEAVRRTLLDLLPGVDELDVGTEDIVLRGPEVGECSLASLSDGYLTTLGWVVDLIARWAHGARRSEGELAPGFNKKMTGLVLIDEIDLHLHPRWQTHIVSDLRRAFPRMSFVVTTHNPLTLLGSEPGEVHVLRRVEEQVEISQVDLPAGIRADQVLTGVWFGLPSTLDAETRGLLEDHRKMLRRGVERSHPHRLELERRLRLRLGSFADTSEDRLAQEVAARHMAEDRDRDLTAEERSALQEKIVEALRAAE